MDIYLILCYNPILYYLFGPSNCSSFGYRKLFQLASVPFDILPQLCMAFCFICFQFLLLCGSIIWYKLILYIRTPAYNQAFLQRCLASFIWMIVLETKSFYKLVCVLHRMKDFNFNFNKVQFIIFLLSCFLVLYIKGHHQTQGYMDFLLCFLVEF